MLTIKLFLENSGRTLRLDKDFPVYQGQFNNILLNVFVPTDILAPYFTKYANVNDTIISPYVAGTSVCVGSKTIARNGIYKESKKYYLRFVKTLVKDGVSYALFERKLPKEFTTYAGENNIIVNVNNIEFGEIKSANATTDSTHFVLGNLDLSKVQEKFPAVSLNYTFKYNGTEWLLNGEIAVLETYGINIESGTPEINDEILLKVYAEKANTTNITTTQPVTMEVMASNQFDGEPAISTSELETLQAYINELTDLLSHKQDKQDNGLQTQIKTVVGAINELVHLVVTNERVIGTYNFISSVVDRLPTNEEMLEFVRSVMGTTYELQGNEVVYTIKNYAGIKTTYKSIYSYDTNKWLFYEVTQIMTADNGVKGIVEGTYGLGYNYDTIVKISGGRIVDIVIKVDGKYVNIRDAFTTEKWVKEYCKNNYAPIQLSQQLYFSKKNEEYIINNEVVTSETSFEKVVSETTLDIELLSASYTLPFEKLEISKDNKFRCCIYIMSNINTSMPFRLETKIKTKTVNIQKSTYITLESNKLFKLEFESPFEELGDEKITTTINDKITVRLIATRNISENPTFTVISSTDYPSTYSLLLDTKAIINGKIEQELGNSENSVISQKAITNIVGNYLVMSISSTTGSIAKTDFEYLKEEFEYNGKKAQHRGIIAVNGTEKMEYKFEIEKDNKLYFIGSKMVGEVLTFYEMEIVKATEETYNWTISEKKAGGTTVEPIIDDLPLGTTLYAGIKINNLPYKQKGTVEPIETIETGWATTEIAGFKSDNKIYEIPRKEIVFSDGAIPTGSIQITQIKAIIDGVEKVFYFKTGSGGSFITVTSITKETNGFNIVYDGGSQFFLPVNDSSNVEISTDGKSLIFKAGADIDNKSIIKDESGKLKTNVNAYDTRKQTDIVPSAELISGTDIGYVEVRVLYGTEEYVYLHLDEKYSGTLSLAIDEIQFTDKTCFPLTAFGKNLNCFRIATFPEGIWGVEIPLYFGAVNNKNYFFTDDDTRALLNNEIWQELKMYFLNLHVYQSSGELKKIDGKFLIVDGETIKVNEYGVLYAVQQQQLEIDGTTIVKNTEDKLSTAVGGYDTTIETPLFEDNCKGQIAALGTCKMYEQGEGLTHLNLPIEDGVKYVGSVVVDTETYTFNGYPSLIINLQNIEFMALYIGKYENNDLYLGYSTNEDYKNCLFVTNTTGISYSNWNYFCQKVAHLTLSSTVGELSYINSKFIEIDVDTMEKTDNKLSAKNKIDGLTIIKNDDGKNEVSMGGYYVDYKNGVTYCKDSSYNLSYSELYLIGEEQTGVEETYITPTSRIKVKYTLDGEQKVIDGQVTDDYYPVEYSGHDWTCCVVTDSEGKYSFGTYINQDDPANPITYLGFIRATSLEGQPIPTNISIEHPSDIAVKTMHGECIPIDGTSIIYDPVSKKLKSVTTVQGAMTYKGGILHDNLPPTAKNGDYYLMLDTEGTYKGQCAIWSDDGGGWQYSTSNITVDTALSDTSTNPVQNKTLKATIDKLVTTDTEQEITEKKNFAYDKLTLDDYNVLNEMSGVNADNQFMTFQTKLSLSQKGINNKIKHFSYVTFLGPESPTGSQSQVFYCFVFEQDIGAITKYTIWAMPVTENNAKMYVTYNDGYNWTDWTEIGGGASGEYLPLTGGTLTGNLYLKNANIVNSYDSAEQINKIMHLLGGTNWQDGAGLDLHGMSSSLQGSFDLFANNGGTSPKALRGYGTGKLTWVNDGVATYKVGDVYETLTPTTVAELANRFGGEWETLPNRYEWDEVESAELPNQSTSVTTVNVKSYTVSTTGMVTISISDAKASSGAACWKMPAKYRPRIQYSLFGSMWGNAESSLQIKTDGYIYTYNASTGKQFGGMFVYQAKYENADRTFYRYKRKS